MEVKDFKCDACGSQMSGATGWLISLTDEPHDGRTPSLGITFAPIEEQGQAAECDLRIEHICSHACAIKRFSQWLGTL